MNFFKSEFSKGVFVVSECPSCKDIVWPPSDYCNQCLGPVNWRKSTREGKILEFSKKDDEYFCLAEFEKKIRIMGKLVSNSQSPNPGKNVFLESCQLKGNEYNFTMRLI